ELPHDGTRAPRPPGTEVLHAGRDRPGLVQRDSPVPVLEPFRDRKMASQSPVELRGAVFGLLVLEHPGRSWAERFIVDGAGKRRPRRRRLETELGDEPWNIPAV